MGYQPAPIVEAACVCVALNYSARPMPAATYLGELVSVGRSVNNFDSSLLSRVLQDSRLFMHKKRRKAHEYTLRPEVLVRIRGAGLEGTLADIAKGTSRLSLSKVHELLSAALVPLGPEYAPAQA